MKKKILKYYRLPANIKEFMSVPDTFVTRHLRKNDSIVDVGLFPSFDSFLLCNPDEIEHVYLKNGKQYQRGVLFDPIRKIIGNGLPIIDGDFWRKQRRMMQPAFHNQVLPLYANEISLAIKEMVNNWKELTKNGTTTLNIEDEMMNLTSNITLRLLFSSEISRDKQDKAVFVLNEINKKSLKHITNPLAIPMWVPTLENIRFKKHMNEIHEIMDEVIEKRKSDSNNYKEDLLQMLLDSVDDETGETMSEEQLKSEILNLFIAGTETTASVLAWTFHLLANHKNDEKRVREEIENAVSEKSSDLEIIRNLNFTNNVMQEIMRIYPPAWLLAREAMSDDEINGLKIKKGSQLLIPIRGMHMDPKYWDEPEKFMPDRFNVSNRHKFVYFPFGGGPHLCMGKEFARMEYFLTMKEVMLEFEFENVKSIVEPEILISLRPKGGLFMNVTKRTTKTFNKEKNQQQLEVNQ